MRTPEQRIQNLAAMCDRNQHETHNLKAKLLEIERELYDLREYTTQAIGLLRKQSQQITEGEKVI